VINGGGDVCVCHWSRMIDERIGVQLHEIAKSGSSKMSRGAKSTFDDGCETTLRLATSQSRYRNDGSSLTISFFQIIRDISPSFEREGG